MKVLLHICCGPCAIYCAQRLRDKGNIIEGLFYNPNIHPVAEYANRKAALLKVSEKFDLKINFYRDYTFEDFFRKISFHEQDERCHLCWQLRLSETAEYAFKNAFNAFTTTLLISPYQDHEKIRQMGHEAGRKHSVQFLYEDFRVGFKESHVISRQMQLYHQKYCGCVYSERDRYEKVSR